MTGGGIAVNAFARWIHHNFPDKICSQIAPSPFKETHMSWLPAEEPQRTMAPTCRALETVVVPRPRDIGGFEVRRVLPSAERRNIGPFVFFDQMGPADLAPGFGIDVRPHPHIGLATVTYLFEG